MKVENYIKLEAGVTLTKSEINKSQLKSLKVGVSIPNDDDYITKIYNADINIIKRRPPDANGMIYSFNQGETESVYNYIKQKYYLSDSEMFTNYFNADFKMCETCRDS